MTYILFPSDFYNPKKIDPDMQREYETVVNNPNFNVILFGYNEWFNQETLVLSEEPQELINVVYRGWMMKPEQYKRFYELLLEKNIRLISNPTEYETLHVFPNVYELVKDDTAKIKTFPLHEKIDVEELKKEFKRFMVKDYVKSVKGTDFPKYFDETVTQEEFDKWMEVFYKYRGSLLTGGIVIKEFLPLRHYGNTVNEWRVFYLHHQPITISPNSGNYIHAEKPPMELIEKYHLPSEFYTVDFAELEDGSWRVIETGDGQVSGLSERQDYEHFFRSLELLIIH